MNFMDLGKGLILLGLALVGLGGLLWGLGRLPFAGRLPGDLQFQAGGISCFVPLATMLLLSLLLTILINVLLRLFR